MAECAWDVSPQSRWADRGHPYAPVGHTNGMASAPDTCPSCTHAWRLHAVSVRHDGRAHDRRPALSAERGVRKHHDAGHGCDVPRGRQPPPESGEAAGDLRETSPALSLVERPSVPFSGKRHRFFSATWHGSVGPAERRCSRSRGGGPVPSAPTSRARASRDGESRQRHRMLPGGAQLPASGCGWQPADWPTVVTPAHLAEAHRLRESGSRFTETAQALAIGRTTVRRALTTTPVPDPRRRQRGNASALRTELVAETPSGNGQPSAT